MRAREFDDDMTELWGRIKLPEWSRQRFFDLFMIGNRDRFQDDEFGRMLLYLVGRQLSRRSWRRSLAAAKLRRDDVAADVVTAIIARIRTGRMVLKFPCVLVLMKIIDKTINYEAITCLRSAKRKTRIPAAQLSDIDRRDHRHGGVVDLERLRTALDDAREETATTEALGLAFDFVVGSIISAGIVPTFHKLPADLRGIVSADDHAIAAFAVTAAIEAHAEDLAACAA